VLDDEAKRRIEEWHKEQEGRMTEEQARRGSVESVEMQRRQGWVDQEEGRNIEKHEESRRPPPESPERGGDEHVSDTPEKTKKDEVDEQERKDLDDREGEEGRG